MLWMLLAATQAWGAFLDEGRPCFSRFRSTMQQLNRLCANGNRTLQLIRQSINRCLCKRKCRWSFSKEFLTPAIDFTVKLLIGYGFIDPAQSRGLTRRVVPA